MGYKVGIDLGTTNSVIAYTEFGKQRCLKVERNEFSSSVLPSCVALGRQGELLVGVRARRTEGCLREFKRHIGRQKLLRLGERSFTPVELSACVLRRLKEGFEEQVGPVEGAVITVPAMFTEAQRRETIEAGKLAGLNVLRVINEPSAAAIAHSLPGEDIGLDALVVDWGGGTLDVSLIDCAENVLDVQRNDGDLNLGGKDVDELILAEILEQAREQGHDLREDREARHLLALRAEDVKLHLGEEPEWDEPIELRSRRMFLDFHLTRERFEELLQPLLDRVFTVIERTLREAPQGALTPGGVGRVICVGGSCLLPAFRRRLEDFFGKPGLIGIDPMEVVALGAAYQAEHAEDSTSSPIVVAHALTHSLGTSVLGPDQMGVVRGDLFSCIIPAMTKIPARYTRSYMTVHDDQGAIEVDVYETDFEEGRVEGIEPWDKTTLEGLPPGPAGSFPIEITFEYGIDQTLSVTVEVPGKDWKRHWIPERQRRLEAGHDASRRKIDEAFERSAGGLRDLVNRAETALMGADAPRSHEALATLKRALDEADLGAARKAKSSLMTALFDEEIELPRA